MRILGLAVALVATSAVTVLADPPAVPMFPARCADLPEARVVAVLDDQTIRLAGDTVVTVALLGVQSAPEEIAKPPYDARAAVEFLRNLLSGEDVSIAYDPTQPAKDAYGRRPAYLYRRPDGLNVNAELIRQGYAVATEVFEHKYQEEFSQIGLRAKELRKGMFRNVR